MRRFVPVLATMALAAPLFGAGSAQAVVVDMNAVGNATVAFNSSNQSGYAGVALVPGTRANLASVNIPTVTSSGPCLDPALPSDLFLPNSGLCAHGGGVMHSNETFALTWDPARRYWQTARDYVEQFLKDVAAASGSMNTPYTVTTQYTDSHGRATNSSVYGGGCIDYGSTGGSDCQFGNASGTGPGASYPANGCPVSGNNLFHEDPTGGFDTAPNDVCLTDAQLQAEVARMVTQEGLSGRTQPGHSPVVIVLTPPGVETCLDSAGSLCSANSSATAQFCSYHGQVNVGGTEFPYVVQPWTALTNCDEPDAPQIPQNPPAPVLAADIGARLVSPISQSSVAAIVNPSFNSWFALDGSEINDNGCVPLGSKLDNITLVGSLYQLQREFNNAGVIETDPNAPTCAAGVTLAPTFVVPSAVNPGDVVEFDGSTTMSTLIVPRAQYVWSFGDGTGAVGPSVAHAYTTGGTYSVKLTVTDRGGNVSSFTQSIHVLGPAGHPGGPPPPPKNGLRVGLQLMPQGLPQVLRSGVVVRVTSSEAANGIASVTISRAAAKRAHIKVGRGQAVVIGRGTMAGIRTGTARLRLHLSRAMAAKLRSLKHVTLTIRMALVGADGGHAAVDVAGHY